MNEIKLKQEKEQQDNEWDKYRNMGFKDKEDYKLSFRRFICEIY